jgi:hypothetical protein
VLARVPCSGLVITPEIGRKHPQHALRIEPVRFGPSSTAVDENAGGFKNMAGDTMRRQQAVQAEAVTSRLKTADNAYRRVEPASSTGPQRRDPRQQGGRVAAIDPMQMWLFLSWHAGGDEPRRCLSSIARRIVG